MKKNTYPVRTLSLARSLPNASDLFGRLVVVVCVSLQGRSYDLPIVNTVPFNTLANIPASTLVSTLASTANTNANRSKLLARSL